MAKWTKIFIAGTAIMITLVLVAFALHTFSLGEKKDAEMKAYAARREELLLQQQKLEAMINDLNSTLKSESNKNQKLVQQLENITKEQAAVQALPPPPPVTIPKPTPKPPVTRAS